MAININLYPPIVDTYIPAFLLDSEDENKNICRVYFSLSPYNNLEDIAHAQVTVRNQYTNLTVLDSTKYPSEIKLTQIYEDSTRETDDKYYIEIVKTDIQGGAFGINQYYKVQIRFTSKDATSISLTTPQAIDSWLTENLLLFSEWSTVCLIRGISEPVMTLESREQNWSLTNPIVYGKLIFTNEEETDRLKSYIVRLYNEGGDLLSESDILYTNNYNEPNSFEYTLKYNFEPGTYGIRVDFTTLNLYSDIQTITFTVTAPSAEDPGVTIAAAPDSENGRIVLEIEKTQDNIFTGTLVIRRSSSKDNFLFWEDILTLEYNGVATIKEVFNDTTIESGVWYKYYIQKIDENKNRGAAVILEKPVMTIFDNMFLTTKDRQLKIKFNPTLNSFKRTIQETRTDTLGSQYPFVRRNGYANYAQFPIGGLISFQMDEEDLFTSLEELFGENLYLYTEYNNQYKIAKENDVLYEKRFRDKILEFLYNGKPKLFRSATEGNFLVQVMDISLSPNPTLGRKIWSFSATAYEIADSTIENYQKYDILPAKDSFAYAKNSPLISPIIGSLMDTIDQPEDIEDSVSGN